MIVDSHSRKPGTFTLGDEIGCLFDRQAHGDTEVYF